MGRLLTRRQLLRHAGLVAATFPLARTRGDWSLSEGAAPAGSGGVAVPLHTELVTVTDTEAVVTWFTGDPARPDAYGRPSPSEAPGRVLIGTSPDPATWNEVGAHDPTAYHHVRVRGLQPGTRYFFRAESAGLPAVPTTVSPLRPDPANAGVFTTLVPPPGRELARVAWMNDLHIGEHASGLAVSDDRLPGGGFPPGFPADANDPYWRFMTRGAVADARAHGARLLLANGDLTSAAEPEGLSEARAHLDTFGLLGGHGPADRAGARLVSGRGPAAYFVTRGNHDRARPGADCSPVPGHPDLGDCFADTFRAGFEPASTRFAVRAGTRHAAYRFVGLDSANIVDGTGQLPDEQLEYLLAQLETGDPTFVVFHHHSSDQGTTLSVPPVTFGVDQRDAARFRELVGRHDNVVGVYNGHTHRNLRSRSLQTGDVPFFEGAAVKEYPGGYTIVRLFEGGYMVNFWKTSSPDARAWSERSRGEYLNLYPYYTLGGFSDRNWTYDTDARRRLTPLG